MNGTAPPPVGRVAPDRGRRAAALAWISAVALAAALLAATAYTSRDPDSTVYAGISARLASEPVSRWIAPEWWGHWGFEGPFREHPVGILVIPAALARAGYPAPQAAYAVNAAFQALCFALVGAIAARVVADREARALTWMLQLLLIAFVFRIRANQEYAVLAGVLAGLYATDRSRANRSWAWLTAAAFAWVLLVKGIFGLVVPALCALWLIVRSELPESSRRGERAVALRMGSWDAAVPLRRLWKAMSAARRPWIALAATLLVLPTIAVAYEALYRGVTGDSFLAFYGGPRLDARAVTDDVLWRWPVNAVWYTGRLVWYSMPWSVFTLGACVWWWRHRGASPKDGSCGALAFCVLSALLLVAAFAAADRRADRFIFPAYFAFGAAGAIAAMRWSPRLSRVVERLDRPWIPAACWMALFLVRLVSGAHLPRPMLR